MLIQNFTKETHHAAVVEKSDLSYPIHMYFFKGKWIIVDGVHRYTKAIMQGDTHINVCKVSEGDIQKVKKSDEDFRKWKGEF